MSKKILANTERINQRLGKILKDISLQFENGYSPMLIQKPIYYTDTNAQYDTYKFIYTYEKTRRSETNDIFIKLNVPEIKIRTRYLTAKMSIHSACAGSKSTEFENNDQLTTPTKTSRWIFRSHRSVQSHRQSEMFRKLPLAL